MKHNFFIRFLSLFLSLIMTVSLLPLSIMAEDLAASSGEEENISTEELISDISESDGDTEEEYSDPAPGLDEVRPTGEVYYTEEGLALRLNSDGASYSVVGFINAAATSVEIDDKYDGKPITHIGDSAFKDKANLKNVTIGANVVYIGDDVFGGCPLEFNVFGGVNYIGTKDNKYFYAHSSVDKTITEYTAPAETRIIGSYAFHNCTDLKKFELHADIIQVGFRALRGCDSIEEVTLPFAGEVKDGTANVHVGFAFGARTYGGNISFVPLTLKSLTILGGTLQKNALYGIDNVTHLGLPTMTAHLGYYYGAETYEENINYIPAALTSVSVKSGDIPEWAFYNCVKITDVELCDGVTSIGRYSFYGCEKLINAKLGSGVTSIGDYSFYNCKSLISITIPNGVNSIGKYAFYACKSLVSIVISVSVTLIGEYAFRSCSSLTNITIPENIKRIGTDAFDYCTSLNAVYITNLESWCRIKFESISANPLYSAKSLYLNGTLLTNITIPSQIDSIGNYVFSGCNKLTSITIPDGVATIGSSAFSGCASLSSITIPNSVTSIDTSAFSGCSSLAEITLSDKIESIKSSTFSNCKALVNISIPDGVISIGNEAFKGCTSLASILIPNSVITIGDRVFYNCTSLSNIKIGNSVSTIGREVFSNTAYYNNTNNWTNSILYVDRYLIEATTDYSGSCIIKDGTIALATRAFYKCISLTDIIIPDSVISIGSAAFSNCASLTSVTIPNSVLSIGSTAFSNCKKLESVTIPVSVTSIKSQAFYYCSLLTTINYTGTYSQWNAISKVGGWNSSTGNYTVYCLDATVTKSGKVTYLTEQTDIALSVQESNDIELMTQVAIEETNIIKTSAESSNSTLLSVSADDRKSSDGLEYISNGDGTCTVSGIGDCQDTYLVIPAENSVGERVTAVGYEAFYGCSNLISVVIPDSVMYIGEWAFYNCSSLVSITIPFVGANKYGTGETIFGCIFGTKSSAMNNNTYVPPSLKTVIITGGTSIGYGAFEYCTNITSVIIKGAMVSIGKFAFRDCTNLTKIALPNSIGSIGWGAFYDCVSLNHIMIPEGVSSIGEDAFYNCISLITVTLPDSVTSIGSQAFYNTGFYNDSNNWVDGLLYIDKCLIESTSNVNGRYIVRDNTVCIAGSAFSNCTLLTDILIPDSITSIGPCAFQNCNALKSIIIPDGVTSIGYSAFRNCTSLKDITIPDSVQRIETYAFENTAYYNDSTNWTNKVLYIDNHLIKSKNNISGIYTIQEGIIGIASEAFRNCTLLSNISIPNSVSYIGEMAFYGCISLASVVVPNGVTSIEPYTFAECDTLAYVEIPDSVTIIGSSAFYNCPALANVKIPTNVVSIGKNAFYWCNSLQSVVVPDKVTSIEDSAFSGCSALSSVTIGNGVLSIGSYAFNKCSSLTNIIIPESVIAIDDNAFYGCSSLESVIVSSRVQLMGKSSFEGCSSLISITIPFAGATKDGTYYTHFGYIFGAPSYDDNGDYVPQTLTTVTITNCILIDSYALKGCTSISSISIPDSIFSIGVSAFYNTAYYNDNNNWENGVLYIGKSLIRAKSSVSGEYTIKEGTFCIADSAFNNCDMLTNAVIPNSVMSMGDSAFYDCDAITTVAIGNGVSTIPAEAFSDCDALTSISIGDGVLSIGEKAFYSCNLISTVSLGKSISWIDTRAFYGCFSLTNITFPNSVKIIGEYAFGSCSVLANISLPASIEFIDELAFGYCSSLEKVTFEEGSKIGFIGSKAFAGTNLNKGKDTGDKTIYYPGDKNEWRFVQKATDWDGDLAITYDQIQFGKDSVTVLYDMKDDKSEFYVGEFVGTADTVIPEIYSGRPVTLIYDKSFYKVDLGGATVSVTIPESVKTIYSNAFYNSPGIGKIKILGTGVTLSYSMITGCESLYDLTVPFLGVSIDDSENDYLGYIFGAEKRQMGGESVPKSLKTVTLPDETYIPEYAFAGCSYLENVNFLADVTYIGKYAFSNCLALKEFVIPDSVEEIGVMIFDNCDGLKTITIGKNIKSIPDVAQGTPAFGLNKASSSLEKYIVSEGNTVYSADARGVLYEKHPNLAVEVGVIDAPVRSELTDYVLPEHIVYIAPYAFAYNTSLRWIQLDRVRRIDKCAFFGATSLIAAVFGQKGVDVNEPEADTEAYNEYLKMIADVSAMQESYHQFIGEQAFAGCLQLRYVNLYSDFIIHIGDLAFFDCESLENIYLSSSLQSLGHRVFDEAMPEYIEVEEGSEHFKSVDGVLYRNTESGYILELYPARKITSESYNSNGEKGKEYETYFALPEELNIVAVQSYAFADSAYLTEVDLSPASDMIVGDYAFSESNVRVVNIGDKVTSIGLVRGEGEYTVFADCMQLSKINVSKDNPYYSSQNGVLFDKLKYKLIKYPVMKADKEYTVPESVSVIASMAFKDCGEIVILSIPSYINTIGLEAFYGARNLSSIYFNHVYAPMSVMENAFTTSTEIEGIAYDPRTMILYSAGCYENGGEGEYGWVNYDGVYNIHECTAVPKYNPAQTGKVYYAVVVVDSTGMPLDNISVTLTDPNGITETIKTGYSNSSQTGLSESGDGIAMFYDLYGTEGTGFAIDFERAYTLSVVDENGRYYTYMTDTLMLDSDMCITYITLSLQPSVYGVDLSGKDINTETAVLNKAEYGKTDRFDFIDGKLVVLEKDVSETVEITVITYYDGKSALVNENCMLYQNGSAIPGCNLVRVNDVELGVSQLIFELPVDQLIPEVPIEAKVEVEFEDGSLATATAFLNIDVIDFTLTADDITLDVGELSIDLEAAGSLLKTLLGKDDLSFDLGKNVQLSIVPDGDTVTVSLNGSYKKEKETKTGKHVESDCEKGYKKNHEPHNKNTWFFKYPAFVDGKEYTVNIRVARGTEKENYYYYQMSIYEGYYALTDNMVARHFGVINAYGGRPSVKTKSLLIYYTYMVKALDEKDITKGEVYKEPVIAPVVGSQTSHTFEVTVYGDLEFKYEKGTGLVPVASTIKGDIKYTFLHGHQFMVWVIPVYFEITVDLEGNLLIKLKYDEGVTVEEAKLTLQAEVTAQVGVGCKVLSAGVKGKIGMVFVLEFAPELGVDSWKVYGGIYAYVSYVTIKFQKGWLGLYYPVVGTDTKEAAIWEGNYYIIGGPDSGASSAAYYAVPVAALYMADAYGAAEPEEYIENATVFSAGGKIYKLGFVNMNGSMPSETEGEYDEYNYLKLALFEWDPAANKWGDYVLIDDNGYNDFYYSVVETENGAGVIFTQQTEKTNAETAENTYDYVSDLVVKYVDLSDIASGMTVTEVWENEYYKYLPTFNTVNGVPVAIWAQNTDNNMFGVSPKNYIDSTGAPQIFATEANSIWMSSFVNGAWSEPVCVADGLSTVMDITVTEEGRIAYIIDTNADMSDFEDRVAYSVAYGTSAAEPITVSEGRTVLSLHADNNSVTYYYEDENGGGIATYDFASASSKDITVNGKDMISSDYDIIRDSEGNITAIIFAQPKTWAEGTETADGSALYGIFPTEDGWGSPVEITTDLIWTQAGVYISEFDSYTDQDGNIILTAEYVDNSGASRGRVTDVYEVKSSIAVESYEVDYSNKKLSAILTNSGALTGKVYYSIDGGERVALAEVPSGETVYAEIELAGYGLIPDVSLYDGEGAEAFECIDDIDLNHVDLRPAVKQLLLGGKNVLLVAVRNDGNLPSSGKLYVRVGNYTVEEMYAADVTRDVRQLASGDIVYFEIPLSGDVRVDDNTVVTVYVSTDSSEMEKGKTPENNILYTTLKAFDRVVDDMGASYKPEVLTGKVEYDPESKSEQKVEIFFTCADVADLEKVSINGTELVEGRDYSVSADGALGTVTIADSYLSALAGGEYDLVLTVDGEELKVELDVTLYHTVSWILSDEKTVTTSVEDGKIPQFEGEPAIGMSDAYVYSFAGWDRDGDLKADKLKAATDDDVYVAIWNEIPREYSVTWVMISSEGIPVAVEETYLFGEIPNYVGLAFAPDGMELDSWDKDVLPVTGDVTYTAVYVEQTSGSMQLSSNDVKVVAGSEFEVEVKASMISDVDTAVIKFKYNSEVATILGVETPEGVELLSVSDGSLTVKLTVPIRTEEMTLLKLRMLASKTNTALEKDFLDVESEVEVTDAFGNVAVYAIGDVDLDGIISAADITALARHLAKVELITDEVSAKTCDTSRDGIISAADLTMLARYIAKIISSFD